MDAMTRREVLGSTIAGGTIGLLGIGSGACAAPRQGSAPGRAQNAVPVADLYRLASIDFHPVPKTPPADPSTGPTPDAFIRATKSAMLAIPNVGSAVSTSLNAPHVTDVTGKAATGKLWTPFSQSLRNAITAARPGSTCVIDQPLYAVNEQTGIHVKSGWLKLVDGLGKKTLFEINIEVKSDNDLGAVIWAGLVYVAVSLSLAGS